MFNGLSVGYVLPWKVTMKNITQSAAVCHHATLIVCCELNVRFFLSEGAKGLISV